MLNSLGSWSSSHVDVQGRTCACSSKEKVRGTVVASAHFATERYRGTARALERSDCMVSACIAGTLRIRYRCLSVCTGRQNCREGQGEDRPGDGAGQARVNASTIADRS